MHCLTFAWIAFKFYLKTLFNKPAGLWHFATQALASSTAKASIRDVILELMNSLGVLTTPGALAVIARCFMASTTYWAFAWRGAQC